MRQVLSDLIRIIETTLADIGDLLHYGDLLLMRVAVASKNALKDSYIRLIIVFSILLALVITRGF